MAYSNIHRALQTTSPGMPNCNASLASSHSCSFFFVRTTAISPIPKGFIVCALRPLHILLISPRSMKTRRLGKLMRLIYERTGLSSRYLSSAHIRRSASPTHSKSDGEGDAMVPRVMLLRKPARNRIERIPRFCVEWSTATKRCRARKAFWRRAQRSWGSGICDNTCRRKRKVRRPSYCLCNKRAIGIDSVSGNESDQYRVDS